MTPAEAYRAARTVLDDREESPQQEPRHAGRPIRSPWAGWGRTSTLRRTTHSLHLGPVSLAISLPRIDPQRRRPILGWMALLIAAVCLDLLKLWLLACFAFIAGVLPIPRTPELVLALLVAIGGMPILAVAGLHALRLAWRCFFPSARLKAAGRRRGPDAPPEARRCGVPVGPRRPSPLAARAKAPNHQEAGHRRRALAMLA